MAEGMSRVDTQQKRELVEEYEAKLKELWEIRDRFLKLHDDLIGKYYQKDRKWHLVHGLGWPSNVDVSVLSSLQLRVGSNIIDAKGEKGRAVFHRLADVNLVKKCGKISPTSQVYCGFCRLRSIEENDAALFLSSGKWDDWAESKEPSNFDYLVEEIYEDIRRLNDRVTVRYWVTEARVQKEKLKPELMKEIKGKAFVNFDVVYTGSYGEEYVYTAEELIINGYDLAKELRSHRGKYIHLEIDFDY